MTKTLAARGKFTSKAATGTAIFMAVLLGPSSDAQIHPAATPQPAHTRTLDCQAVKDARILASDGTYLGSLTDHKDRNSVMNKNGPYGSPTAANSLWNPASPYGSTSSRKSPMNGLDGRPAQLVKNGQVIGKMMRGSLRSWMEDPAKLVKRCYGHQL